MIAHSSENSPVIKVEGHGCGVRWHCSSCDQYHNGHMWMVRWTNSPPPKFCDKCTSKESRQRDLELKCHDIAWKLATLYVSRFYVPGSNVALAGLIRSHGLAGLENPHRLAAIINGLARAGKI